jgi:ribonuclease BN (tRNA processing enzyme)
MNEQCSMCGDYITAGRWALGYRTCLTCGEAQARQVTRTVAPMHKSNYMLITDLHDLAGLNNKGGLVK